MTVQAGSPLPLRVLSPRLSLARGPREAITRGSLTHPRIDLSAAPPARDLSRNRYCVSRGTSSSLFKGWLLLSLPTKHAVWPRGFEPLIVSVSRRCCSAELRPHTIVSHSGIEPLSAASETAALSDWANDSWYLVVDSNHSIDVRSV